MYSRSERKSLEAKNTNPNLGPGCYTIDPQNAPIGRHVASPSYAPFQSLAPRTSYFEELVTNGPAPGSYVLDLDNSRKSGATFGMSLTKRFQKHVTISPGPNTYDLPGFLVHGSKSKSINKKIVKAICNQFPVGISEKEELQEHHEVADEEQDIEQEPNSNLSISMNQVKKAAKRTAYTRSVIWKRKYIPPSIPMGRYTFGYQENPNGELIPRKPPISRQDERSIRGFVDQAKYENRGPIFGTGKKGLTLKIQESPGPNAYNPAYSGSIQKTNIAESSALMTLAPCKRITDCIVNDAMKRNIPGPGSYNIKTPLEERLNEPRNRIKLGAGGKMERAYINVEHTKLPGPNEYYPETSVHPKPKSFKPQPFGSTAKRFIDAPNSASNGPSVGSYEIGRINSVGNGRSNNFLPNAERPVFGSSGARFIHQKTESETKNQRPKSRFMKLVKKGPGAIVVGTFKIDSAIAGPIFGAQTNRFENTRNEVPPPGAYEVNEAFNLIKTKGRVENTGALHSNSKRILFRINGETPGPGEYDPKGTAAKKTGYSFQATGERFVDNDNWVPGPGYYSSPDSGLTKKTFNITFYDWNQKQPQIKS